MLAPEREITFPLGQNKGQMKGGDYLNHFVLPNFSSHLRRRLCGGAEFWRGRSASGTFSAQSPLQESLTLRPKRNGPRHHTPGPLPSRGPGRSCYFRRLAAS